MRACIGVADGDVTESNKEDERGEMVCGGTSPWMVVSDLEELIVSYGAGAMRRRDIDGEGVWGCEADW